MKRFAVLAGTALALVVPASAVSDEAASTATGTAKKAGANVHFSFTIKNGEPQKVFNFGWDPVPMTCDEGNSTTSGNGFRGGKLNSHGRFHKTSEADNGGGSTGEVTIKGKFDGGHKWEGTLQSTGDFNGGALTNCDTGKVDWKAHTT